MRASENPFFHRGPILDPAYFFGRTQEIADILSLLSTNRSCSVVGGTKRGKTSVLLHLQRDQTLHQHGINAEGCLRPYLSMEGFANAAPGAFFHCLLRETLRCPGSPAVPSGDKRMAPMGDIRFADLEAAMARLADAGRRVVFLIDDFDLVGGARELDAEALAALSELGARPYCTFVVAAHQSLERLALPPAAPDSFADAFAPVHLRRFSRRDVTEMVRTLSERAGRLWDVNLDRVMDWTGGVPYMTQLACSLLWRRSSAATRSLTDADYDYVFQEFMDQVEPFLHSAWRRLSHGERETMLTVAAGGEVGSEHDAAAVQDLVKADLLAQHEGQVGLPSRATATFVRARLREREQGAIGFLAAGRGNGAATVSADSPDDKSAVYRVTRALVEATEYWDRLTAGHSEETARLAGAIAARLGLSPEEVEGIKIAARLHDIGKIGVSDRVLLKPEKLTEQEREAVRSHVLVSTRILEALHFPWEVKPAVRYHHERMDGSGYPDGLMGDEIPLAARVLAVADVFTAMTAARSHRSPHPREDAIAEITKHAGTRYDPQVVAAFVQVVEAGGS